MGNNLLGWQTPRIYNSKHLSPFSTIGSTTTGHHRTPSLMSLNSLAPAFLPHHQSSSNPPLSLCNSNTINLPLAQLICGMPPHITPSHALSLSTNTLLTTLSSFLISNRWIGIRWTQPLITQLPDPQHTCPHHSTTR